MQFPESEKDKLEMRTIKLDGMFLCAKMCNLRQGKFKT